MKKNALLLSALILLAFTLHAQNKDSLSAKMDTIFKKYIHTKGPGCAIGIVKDGKVVFAGGYGQANLEYNIPITQQSVFDIASLSKQFTGLAVSTLIQQGKLALDDDIHKYMPDLPNFGKTITIQNLLHHTSGLRDWPEALALAGWQFDEEASFEDIMRMVKQQKELDFDPGSEYQYSNTGYNVLAAIVAKVSGKTFRQYTDSVIFKPLGMTSTQFLDNKATLIPNQAYSYDQEGKQYLKIINVLTAYGSSSLYTSVDDFNKWIINFQQQLSLKNPVYTRMITSGKLNNGKANLYGFGLETSEDRGLKTIEHTGGWAAYRTIVRFYPDNQLSIIILCSSGDGRVYNKYINSVADLFLANQFKKSEKVKEVEPIAVKVDTTLLKKYIGNYKWETGTVAISLKKGNIMFQYIGENAFPTIAISDTSFYLTVAGLPVTFARPVKGMVNSFTFRDKVGTRFIPYVQTANGLKEYEGTYYSDELESQFKLNFKDGKLILHNFRTGDSEMEAALFKDDFSSTDITFHFLRDAAHHINGFKCSGHRVRNIYFKKML